MFMTKKIITYPFFPLLKQNINDYILSYRYIELSFIISFNNH